MDNFAEWTTRLLQFKPAVEEWEKNFHSEFGRLNRKLNVQEAAERAYQRYGRRPAADFDPLLEEICAFYLEQATAEERAQIRDLFAGDKAFDKMRAFFGRTATDNIHSAQDTRWLLLALVTYSIEDLRPDYRDTFINLGELYKAAAKAGIDPAPYFKQVAELSRTESRGAGDTPTRDFLANFTSSAFFQSSVKSQL